MHKLVALDDDGDHSLMQVFGLGPLKLDVVLLPARCAAPCELARDLREHIANRHGGGLAHWGVGAGIVADSQPTEEWEETLNKGRALWLAVQRAERGGTS